jgi:hypothetical protein
MAKTVTIGRRTRTVKEWSKISGIGYKTLLARVKAGKTGRDLLAPPNSGRSKVVTIRGKRRTLQEWAEISGLSPNTIATRLRLGWAKSDLLKPVDPNRHDRRNPDLLRHHPERIVLLRPDGS